MLTKQSTDYSRIIRDLQTSIPEKMKEHHIPGLSIALIDGQETIWTDGFGTTEQNGTQPVTADTPFSLQSISKTYTATGFMLAVSKGLVKLDDPLKKFYPGFRVNSRFGKDQADQITFRHLLSHWAGFTHEAPVGGNYDDRPCTFEEHIRSISDTWLMSPVGWRYSYSNLGIDLAGYVLQLISGKSFPDYMADELLKPLEMAHSGFDQKYRMDHFACARGHIGEITSPAMIIPMIPSGGLFASARDMAKFVSFHLAGGVVNDSRLATAEILNEMYTPQFKVEDQIGGYGLGIASTPRFGSTLLHHGGGGYGYLTYQAWLPEFKIGIVVLTNQINHPQIQVSLGQETLKQMIVEKFGSVDEEAVSRYISLPAVHPTLEKLNRLEGVYRVRGSTISLKVKEEELVQDGTLLLKALSETEFTTQGGDLLTFHLDEQYRPLRLEVLTKEGFFRFPFDHSERDEPGPDKEEWKKYTGIYRFDGYGEVAYAAFMVKNGHLFATGEMNDACLEEYAPALFFASDGEAVAFEEGRAAYGNIPMVKENDPFQIVFMLAKTKLDDARLHKESLDSLGKAYQAFGNEQRAKEVLALNNRLHPEEAKG
jgi:CubicO group peptidase (beta-lactamase class C family)